MEIGGRVLYINHSTKTTQWERPALDDEMPPPAKTTPVVRAPAGTSPMVQNRAVAGRGTQSPTNSPLGHARQGGIPEDSSGGEAKDSLYSGDFGVEIASQGAGGKSS